MKGWIKLHRKLTEWEHYRNGNTFRLFVHLLLNAQPEDCTLEDGTELKRGQLVTSLSKLAQELRLTVNQVRTSKTTLETTGEITSEITSKFSIITVCKFDDYQAKPRSASQAKSQALTQALTQAKSQQNKKNKEEYNNINITTKHARARERLDELLSSTATVEAICKNEGVTPQEFKAAAEAVLSEWAYTEPEHTSESDARRHLINTIRIQLRETKKQNGKDRTINGNRKAEQDQLAAGYAAVIARRLAEDDARTAKVWQP